MDSTGRMELVRSGVANFGKDFNGSVEFSCAGSNSVFHSRLSIEDDFRFDGVAGLKSGEINRFYSDGYSGP